MVKGARWHVGRIRDVLGSIRVYSDSVTLAARCECFCSQHKRIWKTICFTFLMIAFKWSLLILRMQIFAPSWSETVSLRKNKQSDKFNILSKPRPNIRIRRMHNDRLKNNSFSLILVGCSISWRMLKNIFCRQSRRFHGKVDNISADFVKYLDRKKGSKFLKCSFANSLLNIRDYLRNKFSHSSVYITSFCVMIGTI